jgi:hypothetical protein
LYIWSLQFSDFILNHPLGLFNVIPVSSLCVLSPDFLFPNLWDLSVAASIGDTFTALTRTSCTRSCFNSSAKRAPFSFFYWEVSSNVFLWCDIRPDGQKSSSISTAFIAFFFTHFFSLVTHSSSLAPSLKEDV